MANKKSNFKISKSIKIFISEHKILSGIGAAILTSCIALIIHLNSKSSEKSSVNFGDNTEVNDSNISGNDIKIDDPIKLDETDSLSTNYIEKKNARNEERIKQSSNKLEIVNDDEVSQIAVAVDSNKIIITKSNIAGRDINIYSRDQNELINLLKMRAKNINSNLKEYYYYTNVEEFLNDFNKLHRQHIKALEKNNFILAHEILSQIHMLSLSLDVDEEQAQQINLYGELRRQYLREISNEAVIGGIALIYFGKNIKKYDSTKYVGSIVYGSLISKKWPDYFNVEKDSLEEFYRINFLINQENTK